MCAVLASPVLEEPIILVKDSTPSACANQADKCVGEIRLADGWKITAYRNFPFSGSPAVTHAVLVVHGTGRNALGYFNGMLAAATKAGVTGHTMVLAPFFKTSEDKPAKVEARWTSGGWKVGDAAQAPAGLSSFAVMDELVTTLANKQRFPNLNHVTVVGHSAGAQFAQRYAAFGLAPNVVRAIGMNFVVANPSSYLYFDAARPTSSGGQFAVPKTSCKYNDYKYGMSGRSGYVARLTPKQALAQYTTRRVTYLQGGSDTVQNGDMDADCEANLEGPNRLTRGAYFFSRIRQLAPNAPHDRIVVPDIAHDHDAMFEAPQAKPVLFG